MLPAPANQQAAHPVQNNAAPITRGVRSLFGGSVFKTLGTFSILTTLVLTILSASNIISGPCANYAILGTVCMETIFFIHLISRIGSLNRSANILERKLHRTMDFGLQAISSQKAVIAEQRSDLTNLGTIAEGMLVSFAKYHKETRQIIQNIISNDEQQKLSNQLTGIYNMAGTEVQQLVDMVTAANKRSEVVIEHPFE